MSQNDSSDTQFFNSFSIVLGLLIAFTIVLFAFARSIGADIQGRNVLEDPLAMQNVQKNTEPLLPSEERMLFGKPRSVIGGSFFINEAR